MFPAAYVFYKDGPPESLFQHSLPYPVAKRHRIERPINITKFFDPPFNVPPFIQPCQWKPVVSPVSFSPNGGINSNRKRSCHSFNQNDLKRQRLSCLDPYNHPTRNSNFICCSETGSQVAAYKSYSHIPTCLPANSKPTGCVPSLREGSSQSWQGIIPTSSVNDKLSQQILDLFHACEQQIDDLEKKEHCRAVLQRDIQTIFPCAHVFLAGSSLNGFGSRSSDADLCLVIKDGKVNQKTDAVYVLSLVQKLFHTLFYIEKPRLIRAKVPILKFRDRVSGVEFDLNFNNTVGIRNTFLLRTYAYVEKRVRPIVLVIKKWASHHHINDASRGTLSSYTLVLMVLHYLQTLPEPVIPCLQKDYPECFDPKMDMHLVPSGPSNIPLFVSENKSSLGDLLVGFLKYYATVFKWDNYVISVREAKAVPKNNCREWKEKFICVEEPFDCSNTARAVHEKVKFEAIKAEFTASYQVLQQRRNLSFILPLNDTRLKRYQVKTQTHKINYTS